MRLASPAPTAPFAFSTPSHFSLPTFNFSLFLLTLSLPRRLKEHHARGDRNIQTVDAAVHRDRHDPIAPVANEPSEAAAFGTENNRGREIEIDDIVRVGRVTGEPDRPDAERLQLLDRARDVDFGRDANERHRARGRLGGDAVERRRMARLTHDAVRPRGVNSPEDRA